MTEGFPLQRNTKRTTMEAQDNKTIEIPMGSAKEDIKARETIISDVYIDVGMKRTLQKQFSMLI